MGGTTPTWSGGGDDDCRLTMSLLLIMAVALGPRAITLGNYGASGLSDPRLSDYFVI